MGYEIEVYHCTCCGRKLDSVTASWLELDQRIDAFHRFGGIPEDKTQGWFPFGSACAKKQEQRAANIREALAKLIK